jgi:hypothetical protein
MQESPPPVLFTRDLKLLGYEDLSDPRVGPNGMGVNNSGTFVLPDPRKQFYWEASGAGYEINFQLISAH